MKRHGLVEDMPEAEYHGGPELSSTGAKTLVRCPAEYRNQVLYPQHKDAYDVGSLAHRLVLGAGAQVWVVDAPDWRSKDAQAVRREKRAEGFTVVLRSDLRAASRMAAAVKNHPVIGSWFALGSPEVSAFTSDPLTWTAMRARFDWLTEIDEQPAIVDLKTTAGGTHPRQLAKAITDFGYHQQAAWYLDVARRVGLPEDIEFRFVFVSKERPHEVRAVTLPESAIDKGRDLNQRALELYAQCASRQEWPCLHPAVVEVDLLSYAYHL